jgi:hypothetical protein
MRLITLSKLQQSINQNLRSSIEVITELCMTFMTRTVIVVYKTEI